MSKYIDADDVDKIISEKIKSTKTFLEHDVLIDVKFKIEDMPAADVEPVRKWNKADNPPDDDRTVLVATKAKNGHRDIDKGYYNDGWVHRGSSQVTHWEELPELPEED